MRPVTAKEEVRFYGQMAKWVYPTYYAISAYIVLIAIVLASLTLLSGPLNVISKIELAVDGLILIVGVGLLIQNDFIRGIGMYFGALAAIFSLIQSINIVMYNAQVPAMNQETSNLQKMIGQSQPTQSLPPPGSLSANQQKMFDQIQSQNGQNLTPDQKKALEQFQDQLNKQIEQSLPPDKRKAFEESQKESKSEVDDASLPVLKPISPVVLAISTGNIFVFLILMYLIYETEHHSY